MLATPIVESDAEFRARVSKMLDRLRASKEPESLTIDGEKRAVLLSPAVYDEMMRVLDDEKFYASMRVAIQEYEDGKGEDVDVVFDRLHAKLLKMQADQLASSAK